MKKLTNLLVFLAVILSDIMCAVVAYNYCNLKWCGEVAGGSAPASTAFIYIIPFAIAIAAVLAVAYALRKKK